MIAFYVRPMLCLCTFVTGYIQNLVHTIQVGYFMLRRSTVALLVYVINVFVHFWSFAAQLTFLDNIVCRNVAGL